MMRISKLRISALSRSKHTLPDLPYDFNALEPFISAEIMQLHHSKHHRTYVTNLNVFEEKFDAAISKNDVKEQIALQGAIKFNGGGPLATAIDKEFGSLESFKSRFALASVGVQGSGWGWLGVNAVSKRLEIATTANQDPLLHLVPILGVDVWEHAYYLQYKNVRPDYLKAIWSVINWKNVEERFHAATKK